MLDVVIGGKRISDADARERQTLLLREPRMLVDHADVFCVLAALVKTGIEEGGDIVFIHVRIANTPVRRRDFHERFEPQHAARAIANDLHGDAATCRFRNDLLGDAIGAQRERRRIARYVDARHADASTFARARSYRRSNFCGVTRACSSPLIVMAGDSAHCPRQ